MSSTVTNYDSPTPSGSSSVSYALTNRMPLSDPGKEPPNWSRTESLAGPDQAIRDLGTQFQSISLTPSDGSDSSLRSRSVSTTSPESFLANASELMGEFGSQLGNFSFMEPRKKVHLQIHKPSSSRPNSRPSSRPTTPTPSREIEISTPTPSTKGAPRKPKPMNEAWKHAYSAYDNKPEVSEESKHSNIQAPNLPTHHKQKQMNPKFKGYVRINGEKVEVEEPSKVGHHQIKDKNRPWLNSYVTFEGSPSFPPVDTKSITSPKSYPFYEHPPFTPTSQSQVQSLIAEYNKRGSPPKSYPVSYVAPEGIAQSNLVKGLVEAIRKAEEARLSPPKSSRSSLRISPPISPRSNAISSPRAVASSSSTPSHSLSPATSPSKVKKLVKKIESAATTPKISPQPSPHIQSNAGSSSSAIKSARSTPKSDSVSSPSNSAVRNLIGTFESASTPASPVAKTVVTLN